MDVGGMVMAQDCLFCRMASGDIPSDMLFHDDLCFVLRDIHPRAPVHLLIIPRQHFEFPADMTASSEALIGHLFTVAKGMGRARRGRRRRVPPGHEPGRRRRPDHRSPPRAPAGGPATGPRGLGRQGPPCTHMGVASSRRSDESV